MAYGFNDDRSKAPVYTKDEADAQRVNMLNNQAARDTGQDQALAVQKARIDTLVTNSAGGVEVREQLWTGHRNSGTVTLPDSVSDYDCVEFLVASSIGGTVKDGHYTRTPITGGLLEISDPVNKRFSLRVSIDTTTNVVTFSEPGTFGYDSSDDSHSVLATQGTLFVEAIYGIKFAKDCSAEVEDIRVGYDGTAYNTAGESVRSQVEAVENQSFFVPEYELGSIKTTDGTNAVTTTRIRTKDFVKCPAGTIIKTVVAGPSFYVHIMDNDLPHDYAGNGGEWFTYYKVVDDCYIRISVRKNDSDPSILDSEIESLAHSVHFYIDNWCDLRDDKYLLSNKYGFKSLTFDVVDNQITNFRTAFSRKTTDGPVFIPANSLIKNNKPDVFKMRIVYCTKDGLTFLGDATNYFFTRSVEVLYDSWAYIQLAYKDDYAKWTSIEDASDAVDIVPLEKNNDARGFSWLENSVFFWGGGQPKAYMSTPSIQCYFAYGIDPQKYEAILFDKNFNENVFSYILYVVDRETKKLVVRSTSSQASDILGVIKNLNLGLNVDVALAVYNTNNNQVLPDFDDVKGCFTFRNSSSPIVEMNKDKRESIIQSKRKFNNGPRNDHVSRADVLTLLHFSDLHNDAKQIVRIADFFNEYSEYIDDVIHTGDNVLLRYTDGISAWTSCPEAVSWLQILGNHDVSAGDTQDHGPNVSQADLYSTFFQPYVNDTNIVIAENLTYWYKDYDNANVRLIGIDCTLKNNAAIQAQNTWLASVLSSAGNKNVLIATHYPPENIAYVDSAWTKRDGKYIFSFYLTPEIYQTTVDNFVLHGGRFICWIAGHTHYDAISYNANYPNQWFICTNCTLLDEQWGDVSRVLNDKSQDSFNVFSVDTASKTFKIIKIGADCDLYNRHRVALTVDYTTYEIITER